MVARAPGLDDAATRQEATVTFEENEKRRALKKLATQVCAGSGNSRSAMSTEGRSNGKVMLLVGATLITCLGWMTYSRWLKPWHEPPEITAPIGIVDSSNRARVASGTSTSAPATYSVPAGESNSDHPSSARVERGNEAQTYDERLETRVAPVEDFARRGDPKAIPAVLDALHDDDWRVRSRAMDAAVNAYVPIPENTLIDRAQSDPSPEVRFLALAGIAARLDPAIPQVPAIDPETARSLSRIALSDSSEHVRWQAQQILDSLDGRRTASTEDQSQTGTL
jgi:hypothetical protein